MAGFTEYARYDALGLADLVRRREVSAAELCEACIERIERVNPQLNAVITPMYEQARAAARATIPEGSFSGVPFLVKDLVAPVRGVRFARGSRLFREQVADHDSWLIERYRAAGLLLVAKTNTPEFGIKPVTEPELFGPTENPWKPGHSCGGSSGGSGGAVASGMVPMAHGGDGGGSIRIPASCCGVFGLKPTRARTPLGPDTSEDWFGFAIEHALTRSVRDSAALLDATSALGPAPLYAAPTPERPFLEECAREPGRLRIALCKKPHLPSDPHPDVLRAVDDAAALCASLGHEVVEATPAIDPEAFATAFLKLICVATAADLDDAANIVGRKPTHRDVETTTWTGGMVGRTLSAVEIEHERRSLHAMTRTVAAFFRDWDVLLTPTLGLPPPLHGALNPKGIEAQAEDLVAALNLTPVLRLPGLVARMAGRVYNFIPWTPLANVAGLPSMSVPLCWNAEGLPIGVMFTARYGDDAGLFRLAAQLEKARPWADRRPPIHAG
jgi:amidase